MTAAVIPYIYEYVSNRPLFNDVADGGVVKNLNTYKRPYNYSYSDTNDAFIAKRVKSGGTIENCRVGGIMNYSISSDSPKNYNYGGVAAIVDAGGTIKNCVNDFSFTLKINNCVAYIGAIAGENNGTIENCIGMAGRYDLSFTRGSNTAVNAAYVGGIAGKNNGTIRNCLNITAIPNRITAIPNQDSVTASSIAYNDDGVIENCYYDADRTPTVASGDKGLAKTAEQLNSGEVAYLLQGEQPAQVWAQIIGTDYYPVLSGDVNGRVNRISAPGGYAYVNGTGAEDTPYLITNLSMLETARDYINSGSGADKYFKLAADIDMSQKYGEGGASWTPAGNESNKFEGVFDGNAHEISGLYINAPNEEYQGLFGFVGTGGTVKNLTVSGSVTGRQYVGGIAGRIEEGAAVYGCVNKSEVCGDGYFGGVAGVNYGAVTNCANAGNIGDNENSGADGYCSGILGANYGGITRCVNSGTVGISLAAEIKGGIIGDNESENGVADCYYLRETTESINGVGNGADNTISVNSSALASGETAWLLQDGQDALSWGQKLGTDDYPIPTSDSGKQVFKVTFATQTNPKFAERYANPNGKVTLPNPPTAEGQVFSDWSPNTGNGNVFDENTPVTGDITVYAYERTTFGGESGTVSLGAVYGEGVTADLSDYIAYGDQTDTADKFTYTIEDGNTIGASVSGDTLTVPKETAAGEYTLKIKAEEKAPLFNLMSVDDYGFEPVTLTVKITVAKAGPTASVQPNELVFKDKEQYLVTGKTDDGTLVYSMSENGDYSEKVPTGKDAGTYTVWYKVIGDENHNDSEPQPVEVVIRNIESIRIGSYPTNTTVLEGMPFDASGYTLSGYDTSVPGEQAVTVTYGGKTVQFNITVTPKSLTGIELTHTPDKLIYYQGDTLDITGMVITAVYNNNTTQFIDNGDLEISELNDSVGEQTVTVTYGGQSAEFTVTVLEIPVQTETVEMPLIETADFYGGKRVIISCATEDAEIYYTTDETDPTTNSNKYESPIEFKSDRDITIKAIAVKADMYDSDVAEQFVYVEKVAAPMASVKGEVEVGTAVKLLCTTPDAEIYYTTGDELTADSYKRYTDNIIITEDMTVRAIAVKRGCASSDEVTFTYTIAPPEEQGGEEQGGEVNRALLELEDVICKAGDDFNLPAYIYSERAVSDFRFTLEYDSDRFEYLGFEPGEDMPASSVSVTKDERSVTVRVAKEGMTGCEACILKFRAKTNTDSGEYILPVGNIEINAADKSLTDIYYTDGYVTIIPGDAKILADAFLFNSDGDVIEDASDVKGTLSAMILAEIVDVSEDEKATSFDAILAFYDTNGALVTMSKTKAEMSDDMDCFIAEEIIVPENAEIGEVKLMVWDEMGALKPLMAAAPVL